MLKVGVTDPVTWKTLQVNDYDQVVVGDEKFSKIYQVTLDVINTPYAIIEPLANHVFIVKLIALSGNRNIGANGSLVQIYESIDGGTTGTVTKAIYSDDLQKQTRAILPNLNLKITRGNWLSAECDDDDVRVTVVGFYTREYDGTREIN